MDLPPARLYFHYQHYIYTTDFPKESSILKMDSKDKSS